MQSLIIKLNKAFLDLDLRGLNGGVASLQGPETLSLDYGANVHGYLANFADDGAREYMFCELFQRMTGIGIVSLPWGKDAGSGMLISTSLLQQLEMQEIDAVVARFTQLDQARRASKSTADPVTLTVQ